MDKPQVSVIIPAYNAANTITACIRSIKSQSFSNIEVIVIDDCSTDDTYKIARREIGSDPAFRVIRMIENRGAYMARMAGVKISRSSWITFIDADDMAEDCMVEALYKSATQCGADIAIGGVRSFDHKYRYVGKKVSFKQRRIVSGNPFFFHCTGGTGSGIVFNKLYHKNVLSCAQEINCEWRVDFFEDTILNLQAFFSAQRIVTISDCVTRYLVHNSGVTGSSSKTDKLYGLLKAYAKSLLIFQDAGDDVHKAITICFKRQIDFECYSASTYDILASSCDMQSVVFAIRSVYPLGILALLSRDKLKHNYPNSSHASYTAKAERIILRSLYKYRDKLCSVLRGLNWLSLSSTPK